MVDGGDGNGERMAEGRESGCDATMADGRESGCDEVIEENNVVNELANCGWKPKLGMSFDSEQAAYDFYNTYGGKVGFSIKKLYAHKNKHTKEITSRTFVCYKEGTRGIDKRDPLVKFPRQEVRCGCRARFSIKLDRNLGKYVAIDFVEHHNHDLVPQECIHMLPSQRKISTTQAIEVELAAESGIPLRSAYELFGRESGGRASLGFTKLDQKNYLRSKRQKDLEYGEAGSVLQYFRKKSLENPSFYYAVQLDCEEQISNIFWADAQMIMDYAQFGDVVTFDTTYKLNNEHRPFETFVGFNHHRETVVFGAALMHDETAESFTWLFQIFLEDYLNCDHNLMEFFKHFERVLYDKRYKELEAEYNLCQKLPRVAIPTVMLKQMADIYTKTIFEEFQNEYVQSIEASIVGTIHDVARSLK
ncbi:protein FAR1-RELATED SEQUENCE 5-like [Camellia sinensis]|uniref:protein FAR1-RELATED SEQUENCE 5-like n=1 Tax=Camellia sinensis TaxID=4442 RepID=UPI0010360D0D|nr:protein FAR1-RELATED SEQUENCE 5-like [Camellia sinensis]